MPLAFPLRGRWVAASGGESDEVASRTTDIRNVIKSASAVNISAIITGRAPVKTTRVI